MLWKAIKDYDGYYEVSDTGLVRSLDRIVSDSKFGSKHLKGRMMKLSESKSRKRTGDGYLVVNLRRDFTSHVVPVHRLVAETFIPNPHNLPTVNHKDGNKHNNDVSNLEWASHSENNIHAIETKLRMPRGNKIAQIDILGNVVSEYKSASEASRKTGISRGMISHCLNGRANKAGGFFWKKIEKCNDYLREESTVEDEFPSEAQERVNPEDIVCTNRNV